MRVDRVLLVDDEVDFVEALAERMRTRGLEVATAYDGQMAVDLVRDFDFDAIVLDLAMPGEDGIETLTRLREFDATLQVMLLTGKGSPHSAAEAMRRGAVDVFEKPADVDTLVESIREARAKRIMLAEEQSREDIEDILKRRGW